MYVAGSESGGPPKAETWTGGASENSPEKGLCPWPLGRLRPSGENLWDASVVSTLQLSRVACALEGPCPPTHQHEKERERERERERECVCPSLCRGDLCRAHWAELWRPRGRDPCHPLPSTLPCPLEVHRHQHCALRPWRSLSRAGIFVGFSRGREGWRKGRYLVGYPALQLQATQADEERQSESVSCPLPMFGAELCLPSPNSHVQVLAPNSEFDLIWKQSHGICD